MANDNVSREIPYPFELQAIGDGFGLRGVSCISCSICQKIVVLLCPFTHYRKEQIRATLALRSALDDDPWIVLEMPTYITLYYPEHCDYSWIDFWNYRWKQHDCRTLHHNVLISDT